MVISALVPAAHYRTPTFFLQQEKETLSAEVEQLRYSKISPPWLLLQTPAQNSLFPAFILRIALGRGGVLWPHSHTWQMEHASQGGGLWGAPSSLSLSYTSASQEGLYDPYAQPHVPVDLQGRGDSLFLASNALSPIPPLTQVVMGGDLLNQPRSSLGPAIQQNTARTPNLPFLENSIGISATTTLVDPQGERDKGRVAPSFPKGPLSTNATAVGSLIAMKESTSELNIGRAAQSRLSTEWEQMAAQQGPTPPQFHRRNNSFGSFFSLPTKVSNYAFHAYKQNFNLLPY